jgi:hypothetical protein
VHDAPTAWNNLASAPALTYVRGTYRLQNNEFQEEIERANDFTEAVEKLHAEKLVEIEANAAAAVQAQQWSSELSMMDVVLEFLDMPPCRQSTLAQLAKEHKDRIERERAGEVPPGPPFDASALFAAVSSEAAAAQIVEGAERAPPPPPHDFAALSEEESEEPPPPPPPPRVEMATAAEGRPGAAASGAHRPPPPRPRPPPPSEKMASVAAAAATLGEAARRGGGGSQLIAPEAEPAGEGGVESSKKVKKAKKGKNKTTAAEQNRGAVPRTRKKKSKTLTKAGSGTSWMTNMK